MILKNKMVNQTLGNGLASTYSVEKDRAITDLVSRVAQIARYDDRMKLVGAKDEDLVHELELYIIARDFCARSYGFSPHGFDAAVRANVPERYYSLIV